MKMKGDQTVGIHQIKVVMNPGGWKEQLVLSLPVKNLPLQERHGENRQCCNTTIAYIRHELENTYLFQYKITFPTMGISIIKIRLLSQHCNGTPFTDKMVSLIETAPMS